MDQTRGFKIPPGVLPEVDVLESGLAILYKPSGMDRRQLDLHINQLDKAINSIWPSFDMLDSASGGPEQLKYVIERMQSKRKEALEIGRLFFVVLPFFKPRVAILSNEADHVFHYVVGPSAVLLVAEKINRRFTCALTGNLERRVLELAKPRSPERKSVQITLPEGMSAEEAQNILDLSSRTQSIATGVAS